MYLEIILGNGLAERTEGTTPRYRTTAKGFEALRHFRELETLIPELRALAGAQGC
jgi:predicted transcriptional regulator